MSLTQLNSIIRDNIGIMDIPEGEKREKGKKSPFKENIDLKCPDLGKELDLYLYISTRS